MLKKLRLFRGFVQQPLRVTCLECGFLALGVQEVSTAERCMLSTKGMSAVMPTLETLRCHRSLWVGYDLTYSGNPDMPKLDVVTEWRRCEGFLSYKPGLSPEEHMERLARSDERKAQFAYTLLAAILGGGLSSVLTLLGLWAAKHFGLSK